MAFQIDDCGFKPKFAPLSSPEYRLNLSYPGFLSYLGLHLGRKKNLARTHKPKAQRTKYES